MKNKIIFGLFLFFFAGCFIVAGSVLECPVLPPSSFMLQEEYARRLEDKLVNLLEPAAGVGNVRASVQAEIAHQDRIKKHYNPMTLTETKKRENGFVLMGQSISVLINGKNGKNLSSYKNLVKAAVGYNSKRGDRLSVELLPFAHVPLWTLGLSPVVLARIGSVLVLGILLGVFFLFKEWAKTRPPKENIVYFSDEKLWQKIGGLSPEEMRTFLQEIRPETAAFILSRFRQEKADEIVSLLPQNWVNQMSLHLSYIERLNEIDKRALWIEAEANIRSFLKRRPPEGLDELVKYSDDEIQNLLHYVSKADLVKALQTSSLAVQQILKENIPPILWQELIVQTEQRPCSVEESQKAQEKIKRLAHLLKESF